MATLSVDVVWAQPVDIQRNAPRDALVVVDLTLFSSHCYVRRDEIWEIKCMAGEISPQFPIFKGENVVVRAMGDGTITVVVT